jgi:dTDP-4-dehydrorhamnose 3,5-epimerase
VTVTELPIPGLLLIEPKVFHDDRGFFLETFRAERYAEIGVDVSFVQINQSRSRRHTLRGLHFQRRHPQGKLVRVSQGAVYDVVVDLRAGSETFGQQFGMILDDVDHRQLWIPPGFAHGFCVISEQADFLYACTEVYRPDDEGGIRWDDPDLGIDWPISDPILSDKDRSLPLLKELGGK